MNFFQFKSFSVFTVRAGPQVGPGRFQAGMEAEEAGLRAGPDRGQAGARPEQAGLVASPGRGEGRASTHTSVRSKAATGACRRGDRALAGGEHVRGGGPSVHGSDLVRAFDAPSYR